MSIMTVTTRITRQYLERKTKSDLAQMYLDLLDDTEKYSVAWLIERGGLCLGFCDRKWSWITFTNEAALRFSRRSDAIRFIEAMREQLGLEDVLVTEHSWSRVRA